MLLELVSRDDAIAQLHLDEDGSAGSAEDVWLSLAIPAISQAVALWLKDDWRLWVPETDADGTVVIDSSGDPVPEVDSSGEKTVQPIVRMAVLLELASQNRFREGEGDNGMPMDGRFDGPYGYILSKGATALLSGLRKPTMG